MALSPAERLALGLDEPGEHQHASEFEHLPMPSMYAPQPRQPNLKLILKEGEKASAPKIRNLIQELLAGNVDNAAFWLQQVGAANPKAGVELFIELAQFSLPKLKAVAVQVDDRSDNPRSMTTEQLLRTLVSEQ
jgi:hypothetical protein